MSVAIAYQCKNTVCLGTDSRASDANTIYTDEYFKTIQSGKLYIGFVGSFRYRDLIRDSKLLRDVKNDHDAGIIRDSIRSTISRSELSVIDHNSAAIMIGSGGIWVLGTDWHIQKIDTYVAIGAGAEIALGCMCAIVSKGLEMTAEEAVDFTMDVVYKHSVACGGPKCLNTVKLNRRLK